MSFFLTYVLPVALPLFLIPCFLPWRGLCWWVPIAAAGITLIWWNHLAHAREGNGLAVALAEIIILGGTAAAIAGVAARILMLALRAGRVRWRYAWLPAPSLFALLIAAPWLLSRLSEFQNRPPSDACLAATYRIEVGGAELHLPLAPVFTVFRAIDWRQFRLQQNGARVLRSRRCWPRHGRRAARQAQFRARRAAWQIPMAYAALCGDRRSSVAGAVLRWRG